MSSVNYPQPVQVNGYLCRNCSDVSLAKKHIDPSHPSAGPYGEDSDTDAARKGAVSFGGALSGTQVAAGAAPAKTMGTQVNVTA